MKDEFIREILNGMTEHLERSSTLRRYLAPLVRISGWCCIIGVDSRCISATFQNVDGRAPCGVNGIGYGVSARGLNIARRAIVFVYLCNSSCAHASCIPVRHFAVSNNRPPVQQPNEEG
jgi:hypothetical protein